MIIKGQDQEDPARNPPGPVMWNSYKLQCLMEILKTYSLEPPQHQEVFELWNTEYPVHLGFATPSGLDQYLKSLPRLRYYLAPGTGNRLLGWAMVYGEEGENWFALTVRGDCQGQGKGTLLLDRLKEEHTSLNGWVIDHENDLRRDGQVYHSPLAFYLKNDFTVFPGSRLELPELSAVRIQWSRGTG